MLRVSSVFYLDKFVIGPAYYWVYFPQYEYAHGVPGGLVVSMPVLFLQQLVFSVTLWIICDFVYDRWSIDIVGLAKLKQEGMERSQKWRGWFPRIFGFFDRHMVASRGFLYLILTWQIIAYLVLLCMRLEGKRWSRSREFAMLAGSCVISTVWWTLYTLWIYKPLAAFMTAAIASIKTLW